MELRNYLKTIAPYPKGCVGLEGRPTMNGTAFFPGGDGVIKRRDAEEPGFPVGGVLVLGSDFGDVVWYDAQFVEPSDWREELSGATWRGLFKLIDCAGIARERLFCTNAWPCLREGDEPVKGGIPGLKDREFTNRCGAFLERTVALMRPAVIVPLGIAPTAFVASVWPEQLGYWLKSSSWRKIDEQPVAKVNGIAIVPVVHPSMPNRRHRIAVKTLEDEARLIISAYRRD